MKFLLDTQLLLWTAIVPDRIPPEARALLDRSDHQFLFSAASIWEVAIKASLGRADFTVDARVLRRGLLDNGYVELPISGAHAAAVADLPALHRDPFDRLLVAQAQVEGITLLTADSQVSQYPGPVRLV